MSDNGGAKEHVWTELTSEQMTYARGHTDYLLEVSGVAGGPANPGIEENTNESKGKENTVPPPTGEPHREGEAPQLEECY
jgi:hypothetical protein